MKLRDLVHARLNAGQRVSLTLAMLWVAIAVADLALFEDGWRPFTVSFLIAAALAGAVFAVLTLIRSRKKPTREQLDKGT